MNEPMIEMLQSVSVDFCFLICSILAHWNCFSHLSPAAGGLFDTWSGHSRDRSWIRRRLWDNRINRTDGKGSFSWTWHDPTKTYKNMQQILTHQKRCMFLLTFCWSEGFFNFEKAGYLTWNAWIWSKKSGRKQLRWDFIALAANSVQIPWIPRCEVRCGEHFWNSEGIFLDSAVARKLWWSQSLRVQEPRAQFFGLKLRGVSRHSLIVRWFFGFQGRGFATGSQGCDSNTSSGWRARKPKVRTSLLWISKVYMTAHVVVHLLCGNLGISFNWPRCRTKKQGTPCKGLCRSVEPARRRQTSWNS